MGVVSFFTKKIECICCECNFTYKLCHKYYEKMVNREVLLGNISKNDKVLCIGGGPIPSTAIEINKLTDAMVYVLDIDPLAVQSAKKLISDLNLEKKVKIILSSCDEFDLSDFSIIHIAKQVYPKMDVIKKVVENAKVGARILVRNPKNKLKLHYDFCDLKHIDANIVDIDPSTDWVSSTCLLIKHEGVLENEKNNDVFFGCTDNTSFNKVC